MKPLIELLLRVTRSTMVGVQKTMSEEFAKAQAARAQRLAAAKDAKPDEKAKSEGKASTGFQKPTMDLAEAKQILNVENLYPDMKSEEVTEINARYDKMYDANKWVSGTRNTPTYLQSRIYRAKERVDQELAKQGVATKSSD